MIQPTPHASARAGEYPDNPVLCRVWRGGAVESQHRGAWVMVDSSGAVLQGVGAIHAPVFARSSVKSLQALPLIESGAAEAFGLSDEELALCIASHSGEALHVERVRGMLARMGLSESHLACGSHRPWDGSAADALRASGAKPSALHNNCSGKHAGFLALALHLGEPAGRYLHPESAGQRLVQRAVAEMSGADPSELELAIDGCSAPSFRLPLSRLATAIARLTTPQKLFPSRRAACDRIAETAAAHPELVAGSVKRLCTDILRATEGAVFPKLGAEAVYVLGLRGKDRCIAIKIDDGSYRGFNALVIDLMCRFDFIRPAQARLLEEWRESPLLNWSGIEVGHIEVVA